jgi:hypothetical protein
MEAKKFDSGKVQWTATPPLALESVAKVMTYGAQKYDKFNFLSGEGLAYSRLIDALLRHLWAFIKREDTDPESGEPHLSHLCCCALMLLELTLRSKGKDDRL